jgi:hypothetical protein
MVSLALRMPLCTTPSAPEETGSAIATMSRPQADCYLGENISVRSKTDAAIHLTPSRTEADFNCPAMSFEYA